MSRIHFRDAMPADAAAVAALHADSWRRHYRGAYADGYLDSGDELAGFVHVILDADRDWGHFSTTSMWRLRSEAAGSAPR